MAGRIPKPFIDDLINRSDIVEVIERRVTLKKAGKNYQACCPFHNEKTPSFSVSPDKQFYYCFGCGATGNVVSFVMEYDGLDFVEAIEDLAASAGLEIPYEKGVEQTPKVDQDFYRLMTQITKFYQQQLKHPAHGERAVNYMKNRGLTGEIARDFELGYAPDEWHSLQALFGHNTDTNKALVEIGMLIEKDSNRYDRFRDRIMFPIRDKRGRVIAFGGRVLDKGEPKYLNSPETPIFHKGQELYGLYEVRQKNRNPDWIVVVEGYMDVVSLAQFGVTNAVATLGTATSQAHIQQLFRVTKKVVFCFDGDRAGRDAALRALNQGISQIKDNRDIRFLFLPDGEDPDTYVRQFGAEAFSEKAQSAPGLFEYLMNHLTAQVDMNAFEGPGQLANLAKPFIEQIKDPIHKERFLQQLAVDVGLSEQKLALLLEVTDKPVENKAVKRSLPLTSTSQLTPVRRAITLLLHFGDMATLIKEHAWIDDLSMPGTEILVQLVEMLKNDPTMSLGSLIEHWRGDKAEPHLVKLAQEELLLPKEAITQEFLGLIEKLEKLYREQRLSELQKQAQRGRLSAEQKKEFQSLLLSLK